MLILKDVGSFVGAVALCGFVGPRDAPVLLQ